MAINKVGSKGIEDGSVASADFAPNTVTSAKLQDNAVTNAKLTNSSVTLAGSSVSLGGSVSLNNKFVDWQSVITADGSTGTTAVSGRGYFIDTTSAAHTITLPASASRGDLVAIKDYAGTFNTNNLTIARNGHNIQGVANDSLITTNRASLVLVYVDSTKGWLYWEEHNVADLENVAFITATGGTVTNSGDYKIHTFTGDGCFVVSAGAGPVAVVDYLVVAGGGGGGALVTSTASGGGGGAGGFRESHSTCVSGPYTASPLATPTGIPVTATTYPVTVGGGGAGSPQICGSPCGPFPKGDGSSGSNSVFSTITSTGGGGGGSAAAGFSGCTVGSTGLTGGSGGGGGTALTGVPGGSGNTPPVSPSQGNNGGSGRSGTVPSGFQAGGGGGATAVGGDGASGNPIANAGGAGATTSISGSPTAYAGGGGGNINFMPGPAAPGGVGGGGAGGAGPSPAVVNAVAGTANTGGGGGGGETAGAAGGKGIVIIRYKFQ